MTSPPSESSCGLLGQRLRKLRKARNLSQGDIEERTGLLRCYTSRVENGYIVPSVGTLMKYAKALDVPLYQLFYDGAEPVEKPAPLESTKDNLIYGASGSDCRDLRLFIKAFSRMSDRGRKLLFAFASKMVLIPPEK